MNLSPKEVKEHLISMSDEAYRDFHSSLVPGIQNVLGVRSPKLRGYAKEIAKNEWEDFLKTAQDESYEEILLQGFVIAYAKMEYTLRLSYIKEFVPKIDNWAVCDGFCSTLKDTAKHKEEMRSFLQPYLDSQEEFSLRFAVVMLMDYYICDESIDWVLSEFNRIQHDGYYVKMAVAWAISVCFVKFPEKTWALLQNNTLDDFTYNKALQKMIESLRVDKETKETLRSMKRK